MELKNNVVDVLCNRNNNILIGTQKIHIEKVIGNQLNLTAEESKKNSPIAINLKRIVNFKTINIGITKDGL